MKLALNYSPEAARLLDNHQIEIDVYKCPDWPDLIASAQKQRPAYVHFPMLAGRDDIEKTGWDKIIALLGTTVTPYVNTHLAPRASDFADMPLDTTDPVKADILITAMKRDIQPLTARFGREKVIAENAMWDTGWEIPLPVLEPEIISQVIHDTGVGFLLDLAHARVTALHLGLDPRDYVSRLPLDHLRELHITGIRYEIEKGCWNDHFPMTEPDWALAEWALEHIHSGRWPQPWVVSLEYGGIGPAFEWRSKADVIAQDVPRLATLVQGVKV
jgi:uncharacterized protein (UPF0276 family)